MLHAACLGCPPPTALGIRGLGAIRSLGDIATDAQAAAAAATSAGKVIALQSALIDLSKVKQKAAIDPSPDIGLINGQVPDKTMNALAAAVSSISPNDMPTWLRIALGVALGLGATTSYAKSFVLEHASDLTMAIKATTIAAQARAAGQAPAPAPATAAETPIFATHGVWYKTWWGIGAMAVGALGVGSLLLARRPSPSSSSPAPAAAASTGVQGYRRRRRR